MLSLDWRFFPVFDAIDPASAYRGIYEPVLVATSLLIAILAAAVAFSIAGRMAAATTRRGRWSWAAAGATSMGGGIWSMHFIGMLAFSLPCGIAYDPVGTVLSMLPGVLASGIALVVIAERRQPSLWRMTAGAVLMGAAIGAMHYSGMAAMRPEALLRYDPMLVLVSVVVAVALSMVALGIRFRFRLRRAANVPTTLIAATFMGCAIAGMHYTAMEASIFYPLPQGPAAAASIPPTIMALLITIFAVLIAACTLVATFAGRQNELALSLQGEVTRRKALEHEARSERARLQAIFDAVADAIVTIGTDGRIQQWSSGAQRIFGYSAEEVVGKDVTRYVAAFQASREPKIIGIGDELTAVRKDGSPFPIELAVSDARVGDELFFTGILRDITERKRAEQELVQARHQAEAANEAKSHFLATMSHEIRTPMNGVLGMANLLSSTNLSDRQAGLVDKLQRSGQALLAIINDILDFSKIEAGRFELFEVDFEPREMMAELADLFGERCASKGLELVYFVAEEVPSRLRGDPVRLRQVLINLVGNAVKFTEEGEILVEMSVAETSAEEAVLSVSVRDSGIGIASDYLSQVFESFQQVDRSMTRSRGGSGLGLAIAKDLVALMGGEIGVESELGEGSRFFFTVRLRHPAGTPAQRPARRIGTPLRVLLADANAASAHIIARYLRKWQADFVSCATATAATSAWSDAQATGQRFDAAILDLRGLGQDGIELARKIRRDSHPRPTQLILLVGLDRTIADDRLATLGAFAILAKPARPSELFDCLSAIAAGASDGGTAPFFPRRGRHADRPQFDARILLAEDNPINQEVAGGLLEAMGCRVVAAPNGQVAVKLFAQEAFDLVLMDCEMPVMDGLEATRRIRAIEAEEKRPRTAILAVTAHALAEVRQQCREAGMDDFLAKPFQEAQVVAALGQWVKRGGGEAPGTPAEHATAPSVAAPETLDRATLAEIAAMDPKGDGTLVKRIIGQFRTVTPQLVATIGTKAAEGDKEAMWRAAHSLKSSAGALGARRLAARAAAIEAAGRTGGDAQAELAALEADFAAVLAALDAFDRPAVGVAERVA